MRHVIVTGSRDWTDRAAIWDALDRCDVELLIHGAAKGADAIADAWALTRGRPCARMPAQWASGKAAGCIRNSWMLRFFPTAIVLGFPLPGSKGTIDCINQARALGRQVFVYAQ